jgi:ribonucleoside-diphosphate reductase alpha chain
MHAGSIQATNPCGEVPLMAYESCNLGSINLSKFVNRAEVDWNALGKTVLNDVRFLDNVISINHYPSKLIKNASLATRKIGLGIMGWAEMLIQLNIPYDTGKAVELAEKVMQFIREKSDQASEDLAAQRGVFPAWGSSRFFPDQKIRNATRCSIAPTGTISIIADTSFSIEPLFALAFQRKKILDGSTLSSINPFFVSKLKTLKLENQEEILKKVMVEGSCATLKQLPGSFRQLFKTAMEIDPVWHLKHQIAFQRFTDNAVSKTINLPSSVTIEDIDELYKAAWKQKAKGITVFRNAPSRDRLLHQGIQNACLKS